MSPIIGHLLLVASITLDYYRRESAEPYRLVLMLLGAFVLLIGAAYFVRDPRAFFFGHPRRSTKEITQEGLAAKTAGSWLFVVGCPILWLVFVPRMLDGGAASLASRLIGAYLLFFWLAGSMVLSKFLFPKANRP